MPDGLYERDALAWSKQQADLLRRPNEKLDHTGGKLDEVVHRLGTPA